MLYQVEEEKVPRVNTIESQHKVYLTSSAVHSTSNVCWVPLSKPSLLGPVGAHSPWCAKKKTYVGAFDNSFPTTRLTSVIREAHLKSLGYRWSIRNRQIWEGFTTRLLSRILARHCLLCLRVWKLNSLVISGKCLDYIWHATLITRKSSYQR